MFYVSSRSSATTPTTNPTIEQGNSILPSSLFTNQSTNDSLLVRITKISFSYEYTWSEIFFCLLSTSLHVDSFCCLKYSTMRYNAFSFVLLFLLFSLYRQAIQQNLFHFDAYLLAFFHHCRSFLLYSHNQHGKSLISYVLRFFLVSLFIVPLLLFLVETAPYFIRAKATSQNTSMMRIIIIVCMCVREETEKKSLTNTLFLREEEEKKKRMHDAPTTSTSSNAQEEKIYAFLLLSPISRHIVVGIVILVLLFQSLLVQIIYSFAFIFLSSLTLVFLFSLKY